MRTEPQKSSVSMLSLIKIGFGLVLAVILSPLAGLPPTRFGFYQQMDPVVSLLWLLGGCSAIWIGFFVRARPAMSRMILNMPIVWGPLLMAGVSLVLSPFHALPLRDWTGSAQIAEGILTFLSLSFFSFISTVLLSLRRYDHLIFSVAFGLMVVMSLLTYLCGPSTPIQSLKFNPWAPLFFSDYLIFVTLGVAAIYYKIRKTLKHRFVMDLTVGSIFGLVLWDLKNETMMYAVLISALALLILRITPHAHKKIMTSLIPLGLILGVTVGLSFYSDLGMFLPDRLAHLSTLESRMNLIQATFVELGHVDFSWQVFSKILFGGGWGIFSDEVTRNLFLLKDLSIYKNGAWNPSWEFLNRDLMHSHNMLAEIWSALGLIGVGALLFVQVRLFQAMRREYFTGTLLYLISLVTFLLMWFQLPNTLAFTSLAFVFLMRTQRPIFAEWRIPILMLSRVFPWFGGMIIIWSIFHAINLGVMSHTLNLSRGKNILITAESHITSPTIIYDAFIGGQRQVNYARNVSKESIEVARRYKNEDHTALLGICLHIADNLVTLFPRGGNIQTLFIASNIYGEIATNPETRAYFERDKINLEHWQVLSLKLQEQAPLRGDMLIPYFSRLLEYRKDDQVLKGAEHILSHMPNHPIGMWFKGMTLLGNAGRMQEGMCLLKSAVALGITGFMPISEQEERRIMALPASCGVKNTEFPSFKF